MTAQQCPVPSYTQLAEFDHINLQKICEFLETNSGKSCNIVHEWYSADLGTKKSGATLCIDIDPTSEDKTHRTAVAVFVYSGPRKENNPFTVALGKVKSVGFFKGEMDGKQPWYFVEITDEAGIVAQISATGYMVFSPAYPKK